MNILALTAQQQLHLPYQQAEPHIRQGDLLLYRRHTLWGKMIAGVGRTRYSHIGMAGWTNGGPKTGHSDLMAYEMLPTGGQATMLRAHAEIWPGRIDVYRINDAFTTYAWCNVAQRLVAETTQYDRRKAVDIMREFCCPGNYGMRHLVWTYIANAPLLRVLFPQPTDDEIEDKTKMPYCSEAVAFAVRKSFTDLVRNTPDSYTQPGDLARSPLLHYMFTLDASSKEETDGNANSDGGVVGPTPSP